MAAAAGHSPAFASTQLDSSPYVGSSFNEVRRVVFEDDAHLVPEDEVEAQE